MNYPELRADILEEFALAQQAWSVQGDRSFKCSIKHRNGERGGVRPNSGRLRKLITDQLGTVYDGAEDAARRTGVALGTLYKILNGYGRRSSKGFSFRYA
jgi:hypothetical protein